MTHRNPQAPEAPRIAQARKEAKRWLRLAKERSWPEPKQLAQALDFVAQLKGQDNWHAFVHASRLVPGSTPTTFGSDPSTSRSLSSHLQPNAFHALNRKEPLRFPGLRWGERTAMVGRPGEGKTVLWANAVLTEWMQPTQAPMDRIVAIGIFEQTLLEPFEAALSAERLFVWQGKEHTPAINVFDLPLGQDMPTEAHMNRLLDLIQAMDGAFEASEPKEYFYSNSRQFLRDWVTLLYLQAKTHPHPRQMYEPGILPEVDALVPAGQRNHPISWYVLAESLHLRGHTSLARKAHARAMPQWDDLCSMARQADDRKSGGTLIRRLAHVLSLASQRWPACFRGCSEVDLSTYTGLFFNGHHALSLGTPLSRTANTVWALWAQTVSLQACRTEERVAWVFDETHRLESTTLNLEVLNQSHQHRTVLYVGQTLDDVTKVPIYGLQLWDHVLLLGFNVAQAKDLEGFAPCITPREKGWPREEIQSKYDALVASGQRDQCVGCAVWLHPPSTTFEVVRLDGRTLAYWLWRAPVEGLALRAKAAARWGFTSALSWLEQHYPNGQGFGTLQPGCPELEATLAHIAQHDQPDALP